MSEFQYIYLHRGKYDALKGISVSSFVTKIKDKEIKRKVLCNAFDVL